VSRIEPKLPSERTSVKETFIAATRIPADIADFSFLMDVLRREKWRIAAITLITLVAAFAYLKNVAPTYTSSSRVLLETRQERVTNSVQVVSDLGVTNSIAAGEVEVIRSNLLIGAAVDMLGLIDHPDYDPRLLPEVGLVGRFFGGLRALVLGPPDTQNTLSDLQIRDRVISKLQSKITVSQIGTSYGISISVDAKSPDMAALIANTIAEQYVESQVASKRDATLRATAWLEARIAELSTELLEAETAVVQFRAKMTEELGGDAAATAQMLELLNERYIDATIQHSDAQVRHELLRSLLEIGGLDAVADVVTSPLLETLSQQRAELARQRAELSRTLGDRHPQMIGLLAQTEDIERSMRAEVNRTIEATRSEMEVAANRQRSLQSEVERIQQRTALVSAASVNLSQLERTAAAMQLVYDDFLSRFTETTAQIEFQRPDSRIISHAEPSTYPSAPKKTLLMATAGVFGLSMGVALAFLMEAVNKSVHSSDALRELTRRPVLTLLPYMKHKRLGRNWLQDAIGSDEPTIFKDAIRTLRARLFQIDVAGRPKVLMVTSCISGEGKSTVSLALANSLPRMSVSTVVVDADLRRSAAAEYLNLDPEGGCLTRYLMGEQGIDTLIQHEPDIGVDIVAPLIHSKQAADLVTSQAFADLIKTLSNHYDVVIIDAPPVLDLSDALVITTHADATILVVQSNRAPSAMIRASLQRLEDAGAVVVGTVLTQVRKKDAASREMYSYSYY